MKIRKHHFPKALIAIIAFGLASSLISTAMATLIAGVPYHGQTNWYRCGPACLEMVFDFYGPDVSQTEIADAARTDIAYSGTYTDDMRRAAHFSDLSTSVGNEMPGSVTGYTARGLGYAAFTTYMSGISALKPLIDAGYPIVVLQWNALTHDWGHFRVVIGYDDTANTITAHDPWDGPNQVYSYTDFDNLWAYSGEWALFASPWEVSISSPASVAVGDTFTVTATVTYPRPSPFPSGYSASSSQATVQLPAGLSLAAGETATKTLGTGTMVSGGSASVSWNVNADNDDTFDMSVEAEGQVSGSVATHGANPSYSYTDRIGGISSASVTVSPVVGQAPVASFTESAHTAPVHTPITFDPSGSNDPDGTIVLYEWDWDTDGTYDHSTTTPDIVSYTYTAPGTYTVTLRVTDNDGLTDTATATKTITPAADIWSSDSLCNPKDVFMPGETVYVTVPATGQLVTLYVVADQTAWNDGDPLTDVSDGVETLTLNLGPGTQTIQIWAPPLVLGDYDIVMDVDNDGVFDAGQDLVDSVVITGFSVIPEVPFGTAMTLLSMIFALIGFLGFKRFRPKFPLQ